MSKITTKSEVIKMMKSNLNAEDRPTWVKIWNNSLSSLNIGGEYIDPLFKVTRVNDTLYSIERNTNRKLATAISTLPHNVVLRK